LSTGANFWAKAPVTAYLRLGFSQQMLPIMKTKSRDTSRDATLKVLDRSVRRSEPFSGKQPAAYLGMLLLGASIAFVGGNIIPSKNSLPSQASTVATSPSLQSRLPQTADTNFITDVVDRVGPAVVRIDASRTVTSKVPDAFNDPFFRRFFGADGLEPRQRVEKGTGSGFLIDASGQILTNAHVVEGADIVMVTLKDGRKLQGKVLGADRVTDVAVVKIEGSNLPVVPIGNSDNLKPGEWAIAIGNPLGLDNTVTSGIISATGRSSNQIGVPDKRVEFIQTDAAINPGNSGGPLLNAKGEAIGINTAIIQGAQGLGFSIPINTAQRIANQLIAKGKVDHAYLGIQMVTLTPELQKEVNSNPNSGLNIDRDRGVLIVKVVGNSPAARAGIRAGDIILKIDGKEITDAATVQQLVEKSGVGNNLALELSRNGRNLSLNLKPGAFPVN
jgi:S1-C subfamily serine protease